MPKIAMIGAGSIVFCKTLMNDLLSTECLEGSEFALMSRTAPKLDRMHAFVQRMITENGLSATVSATLDRREALKDADYVIVMIQVGGLDAFKLDYEIPMKHGVDQCIGDTLGPGGVFRALRTIPVLIDLARDMEELCPGALMLQYANPMAMCCWALGEATNVKFIGLCHGVQTTLDLISRYVAVPKDEIDYLCAGTNHMAWFLKLARGGKDLYPLLRENFEKPEYYVNEKVRGEVMRHFGYFMTESTGHLSEYIPWFRSSQRALDLYCDEPAFGGETGAYLKWCEHIMEKYATTDPLAFESPKLAPRSVEFCSYIIEALETGKVFKLNGNVRNNGLISNLPPDCCVEVPIYVDRTGLHPVPVGALPRQCAALCQSNGTVQGLAVHAALNGDPEMVCQAVQMDPLTSAVLTLKEARDLATEMLEAERQWLPQFGGESPRATPTIAIPQGTVGVDVPLDPALAIVHRFGKLAEQATE
ncbi:MAG: alpha-glucosidase/alpha-galactosidase [Armatimonadetes bacterium CG_4_10_14_0_8_um_filter_66_14]|nr:alpha-galactosidase [Armatimonadota bacterium]NCP32560.1 alpha-galactosidase [Armatimonadota bacterium]PIX49894.1 MAG: alpha-glucosidase/alpha-galactosidase [Armatimonadetes bacterium CG_4_8_14_3_um_filter_66_20]PIZ46685.1 MAG: alpha-glucosidase/alpha-galactosidase [Armatimonadetes bacterium CG_4_10_14_0_8_um_filter_66_14]PJB60436.1 MAG: alpha-glucosidase/alpha-galactosidase [Armatimonadetes bacterium CG_4_9_14_3_um_filter_66_14]